MLKRNHGHPELWQTLRYGVFTRLVNEKSMQRGFGARDYEASSLIERGRDR